MTEKSRPRGDFWRILPGVLISLIVLAVLIFLIDWQIFFTALKQANYSFLLLALPVYVVSYLVRSRSWHILLMEEPPFKQVFLTEQAGYLMNNVLPFGFIFAGQTQITVGLSSIINAMTPLFAVLVMAAVSVVVAVYVMVAIPVMVGNSL